MTLRDRLARPCPQGSGCTFDEEAFDGVRPASQQPARDTRDSLNLPRGLRSHWAAPEAGIQPACCLSAFLSLVWLPGPAPAPESSGTERPRAKLSRALDRQPGPGPPRCCSPAQLWGCRWRKPQGADRCHQSSLSSRCIPTTMGPKNWRQLGVPFSGAGLGSGA